MRKLSLDELGRKDIAAFRQMPKRPVCVVLDNIRSGLNVGAAFRTSDAFALSHIHLCGITAQPPQREVLKSAIGATESMDWTHHASVLEAVQNLKAEGWKIIGIEQTSESTVLRSFDVQPNERYALVFGNEVRGISEDVLPLLDAAIEIEQFGTKHSLNVAVCMGVVCWWFAAPR